MTGRPRSSAPLDRVAIEALLSWAQNITESIRPAEELKTSVIVNLPMLVKQAREALALLDKMEPIIEAAEVVTDRGASVATLSELTMAVLRYREFGDSLEQHP